MLLMNNMIGFGAADAGVDVGGLVLSAPASAYDSGTDLGTCLFGSIAPLTSTQALLIGADTGGGVKGQVLTVAANGAITAGTAATLQATGTRYDANSPTQHTQLGQRLDDTHAVVTYVEDSTYDQHTQVIETDGSDGINSVGTSDQITSGTSKGTISAIAGGPIVTKKDNGSTSAYKAYTYSGVTLTGGSETSSDVDDNTCDHVVLSSTLMMMADRNGDVFWADISGTTITKCAYADRVEFETSALTQNMEMVRVDDTTALIMWQVSTQNYVRARLVQYDPAGGGSLSLLGSEQTFTNMATLSGFCCVSVPDVATPRFLLAQIDNDTTDTVQMQAFEIDGTTFTKGTAVDFASGVYTGYNMSLAALSPTQAVLQYCDTSPNRVEALTIQMSAT